MREGWGTPEPGWWRQGIYEWEVIIEGKSIGKSQFYVVDGGRVTPHSNPYFNIKEIKLFESSKDGLPVEDRIYLKKFASATTRYLNIEMYLENFRKEDELFPLELQFNFYNDAGQHKACMSYFKEITDKREFILLDTGYGSDNIGYWYEDKYTLEVIYMDQLIAIIPFEVG